MGAKIGGEPATAAAIAPTHMMLRLNSFQELTVCFTGCDIAPTAWFLLDRSEGEMVLVEGSIRIIGRNPWKHVIVYGWE